MRVAVLGMGAVGGYFGGRLAEAGGDVVFLVRRDRHAVPACGVDLSIASPFGDWRGRVAVAAADDETVRADIVVVATKAFDLAAALTAPALAAIRGARVVPLLNGIRHLDALPRLLPGTVPAGGLAHLMVSRDGSRITHSNRLHRFRFGPVAGGRDEVLAGLEGAMAGARIDAACSPDIVEEMWANFQMLAAFSAVCCLLRAPVGGIVATDNGRDVMLRALAETASVAAAEGHPCTAAHREETAALLTQPGSGFSASMLRDLEGNRPTEADHVVGDMVRRGSRHGLDLPVLECAWAALQSYESKRIAGSPAKPERGEG
jgi:2-dehydropantoate 2-reductase